MNFIVPYLSIFSAIDVRAVGLGDADEPPLQHNALRPRRQGLFSMEMLKDRIEALFTCGEPRRSMADIYRPERYGNLENPVRRVEM